MSENDHQFTLAMGALDELKPEIVTHQARPLPAAPNLHHVLAEMGSLPREALFLGVASDGLPVLLNLYDPVPGPILILGDAGSGKTTFLKTIVHSLAITHNPSEVQFGVITGYPNEWERELESTHRIAIFPASDTSAQDLLMSLASWAHNKKNASQSVLLLIDDLEAVAGFDFDALQNLRWLLLRGPSRRVWPFLTMNASRYGEVLSWIPTFRTRIFGRIGDTRAANALGGDSVSSLDHPQAGVQFSLRENGSWLRFWLPSL